LRFVALGLIGVGALLAQAFDFGDALLKDVAEDLLHHFVAVVELAEGLEERRPVVVERKIRIVQDRVGAEKAAVEGWMSERLSPTSQALKRPWKFCHGGASAPSSGASSRGRRAAR
jgi:hypothetical protein